jgi:hypothetical protein
VLGTYPPGAHGEPRLSPGIDQIAPQLSLGCLDPLGESISKLVNLPAEVAAAWQKASVVIVVELLIACAPIAFEVLGNKKKPGLKTEAPATPQVRRDNVFAMVPAKSSSHPTVIGRYMLARLSRAVGEQAPLSEVYSDPCRWSAVQQPPLEPPDVATFDKEFSVLCKRAGICTRATGKIIYCLDVKLVDAIERVA